MSSNGASPRLRLALAGIRMWERYFRFEAHGLETIVTAPPSLIVGYHGAPWAIDLLLLGARLHDELGYFPRASWHRSWFRVPGLAALAGELGAIRGRPTDGELAAIKAGGQHFALAPGGTREGLRPFWRRHRVDFGPRRGYLRLARTHGMPVIPVVSSGLDEMFLGFTNGHGVSKALLGRDDPPLWLALGAGGVWPLALPFPVKIRQRIGAPIDVTASGSLEEAHRHVTTTMQSMLDDLRRDRA